MKKSQQKLRRLNLSRETIRSLDQVLVGLAQGGITLSTDPSCIETNDSEIQQNCYATGCSYGGTRTTGPAERTY